MRFKINIELHNSSEAAKDEQQTIKFCDAKFNCSRDEQHLHLCARLAENCESLKLYELSKFKSLKTFLIFAFNLMISESFSVLTIVKFSFM